MNSVDVQRGDEVRFRLGDLICPEVRQVLAEIGPDVDVTGRIEFFSDRGNEKEHFAIVSVAGIASPVIVPVDRVSCVRSQRVQQKAAV